MVSNYEHGDVRPAARTYAPAPLVFVEIAERTGVRILKHGDVAICWIWELSLPERSVIPLTTDDETTQFIDLCGFYGDEVTERSSCFDVDARRRTGRDEMLAILETDRPVVLLYLDDAGWFQILQDSHEVDVRCLEDLAPLGKTTIWITPRQVIRDLVTGERTWFHPDDPAGSDRDAVICPGGF